MNDYTKSINISPKCDRNYGLRGWYFLQYLGEILNDLGRSEEAIIDYNTALEINPKNADIYYLRGK